MHSQGRGGGEWKGTVDGALRVALAKGELLRCESVVA
jgi:hypothetical protein